jgi:DDE family transposase
MSKPIPQKYKTTNWRSYNAALKSRGSLTIWFDPGMDWRAGPTGKRGRQPTFSDAAIQTCLTLKVLFRLPLRQVIGLVESLLQLAGLDWPVPDFSTLSRRQKNLTVAIPYRGSKGPLHLLIPSQRCKHRLPGNGQYRHQGRGRRGVAHAQARAFQAAPVA